MAEIKSIKLPNGTVYDLAMKQMGAATSAAAGSAGAVPAPAAGDNEKYLRGDGTWDYPPGGEVGLMLPPTSQNPGREGLVPAPQVGDQMKFLRGDGVWANLNELPYPIDIKEYADLWDFTGDDNNPRGEFYFLELIPPSAPQVGPQGLFNNNDMREATWQVSYFITIYIPTSPYHATDAKVTVKGIGYKIIDYQVANVSYTYQNGNYDYKYDKSEVFSYHVMSKVYTEVDHLYFGISMETMLTANGDGYQAGDSIYPNQNAYPRNLVVRLLEFKNCNASLLNSIKIDDGSDNDFKYQVNDTYINFCGNKTLVSHKMMKGSDSSHIGESGVVPTPQIGDQVKFLRGDATWATPIGTTYSAFSSSNSGLVPAAKSGTTNYATSGYVLTGAGWQAGTKYNTDTDTTYAVFSPTPASNQNGTAGLVPAPSSGQFGTKTNRFLRADGAWAYHPYTPSSTNYSFVPKAVSGTTNLATSAYVLTGDGWKSGTKYNTDTTYANVVAATSNAMGVHGLVPAPNSAWFSSGAQDPTLLYLAGTGTWKWTNTFISNVLTDTSTYKALSAAQGKALNDKIDSIGTVKSISWTSYTATTAWTKQTSKSLALPVGTWLINICGRSAVTANTFQVTVGTTAYNAGNNGAQESIATIPRKVDNKDGQGSCLFLVDLSAATTYYPYVVCGNGTGTQVYMKVVAYKLN